MKTRNKIILTICALLFVAITLSACSEIPDSVYKFILDTPTVNVDDLTLTWEEVENADKYKIYNAENDDFIGETNELTYTLTNIIDSVEVYVKAFFEKDNFMFKSSEKSNVVTVAVPVLETPYLYSRKNSVVWSEVKNASYYKVFNNSNDTLITETEELSYTFENNANQNLNVYVRAYYENSELIDKKSNKSNVVKVNPDILVVNVSQTSASSTNYKVEDYIKKVTFKGSTNNSFAISIEDRTSSLSMVFDNLNITAQNDTCFYADNSNYAINLTIIGNCELHSLYSNAIKVSKLNLTGDSDASLKVIGGNGENGTNGRDGTLGSENGGSGTSGTNGTNGGNGLNAVVASTLNVTDITLTMIGGNGGNGGNGGTGKTYVHILDGGKDGNKNYGGTGGAGGNGGNGGNPGYGVSSSCTIKKVGSASVNNITGNYGKGGNGGKGGTGGQGGNYYNSLGSVWRCSGGSGGKGGTGGNGSTAGQGGRGGALGAQGNGNPVNGIVIGINYGSVFTDDDNNSTKGSDGSDGVILG